MGLSAVGALLLCAWAFYQVGSTLRENRPALMATTAGLRTATDPKGAGLPTLFNEARDVTIAVLKPCKPGKPETCGLLPAIQAVAVNAGAAVQTASDQVKATQPILTAAADSIQATSDHANKAIDAAATATGQARADLITLDTSLAAARPLLEAYTQSGRDLNAILERPAIPSVLDSSAELMNNAAGISADGKKVTDKLTADFLSPQPWWKKVGRYASDTFDYGALFARHVP